MLLFKAKTFSKGLIFLSFCSFFSCEQSFVLPSYIEEKDSSFFQLRREKDTDRNKTLEQSHNIYAGGGICSSDFSCMEICDQIFSFESDEKDCLQLPIPQVYRFETLYSQIHEKDMSSLKEINVFDLKVFLNLSPEPFLKVLRTLGPISAKVFLNWIAEDWKVAEVFTKEDWDFLFLEIFLNEIQLSPISSLKEEVSEGRTFVELAWLKQNDSALFWLHDYFKEVQCLDVKEEKADSCVLAQYCRISESFQRDIMKEIMGFEKLKQILSQRQSQPHTDLESFCFSFCASEKGQDYC